MTLSALQTEVVRKVRDVSRKSGAWFRAEHPGQRVTLASLWRKGVLVRRAWRKGKSPADDANEYRLSLSWAEAYGLPKSCEACGTLFRKDDQGLEERPCSCRACTACHRLFLDEDEDGPQVAKTDELAAKYGDGRCVACWREVHKTEAAAAAKEPPCAS